MGYVFLYPTIYQKKPTGHLITAFYLKFYTNKASNILKNPVHFKIGRSKTQYGIVCANLNHYYFSFWPNIYEACVFLGWTCITPAKM